MEGSIILGKIWGFVVGGNCLGDGPLSSALYVVDLNRFRQLAAGDRLRSQYQVNIAKCFRLRVRFVLFEGLVARSEQFG